jgi:hypothetical protein
MSLNFSQRLGHDLYMCLISPPSTMVLGDMGSRGV